MVRSDSAFHEDQTVPTGIAHRRIRETPIAIVDFETTGLTAGHDRVVEVAIVRVDPDQEPRLVLDTLVNPVRRVTATEIHGITDADVAEAPRFLDIAGNVVGSLTGCVVAAYNVYFDIRFLSAELMTVGIDHEPPHVCLMYLRPMLGVGPRCKLDEACQMHGIEYQATHMAAHDALAAARLLLLLREEAERRGVRTFVQLARLKNYKFVDSFQRDPLPPPDTLRLPRCSRFLSRSRCGRPQPWIPEMSAASSEPPAPHFPSLSSRQSLAAYWDTLKTVISDLEITDAELEHVITERRRLGLTIEQVRSLHARVYASVIQEFTRDHSLDEVETGRLRRLHQCLSKLGWAPGD